MSDSLVGCATWVQNMAMKMADRNKLNAFHHPMFEEAAGGIQSRIRKRGVITSSIYHQEKELA